MKKLLSLILCLILCLSLFACNSEAGQTTKATKDTENSQNSGNDPDENNKVDQYLKKLVEDNDLFSVTVKRAIPEENNKSKYEIKEFDVYNNLSSVAEIADYLSKLKLKPIDPPAAKQTSSVVFELKYKRYDNSTVEINFFDTKLKVSDKEWYEFADYTSLVSPSDFYGTLKDTEHISVLPGIEIPNLLSFAKAEPTVKDGKLQLNGEIVCATITNRNYYETNYNSNILNNESSAVEKVISNLTLIPIAPPELSGMASYYNICIYFDDETFISFLILADGHHLKIGGQYYAPETRSQARDVLYAFNFVRTESIYTKKPINIEGGHISFLTKITMLQVTQAKGEDGTNVVEYSRDSYENNETLVNLVSAFEAITLGAPVEVKDTLSPIKSYTGFRFYSVDMEKTSRADDCYMEILAGKIEGVYYFKINDNYYAIEDSVIENLYNQITFSLQ